MIILCFQQTACWHFAHRDFTLPIKAKRLSLVYHIIKKIHHHHHQVDDSQTVIVNFQQIRCWHFVHQDFTLPNEFLVD